jgi:predicted ArsR family transcriptional regulator
VKFAGTTDEAALAVRSDEPVGHESRTRDRIARSILENGPSTASVLSARVQLTATAVRRHLDALLADGLIEEVEPRTSAVRGRGRPARLFAVTDAGRDSFDQGYDDLATSAMQFLEQHGGREAVAAFARQRVAELEARYRPVVEQAPAGARTEALATALSGDGYAATTRTAPGPGSSLGEQLCQHHCPVAHVAEKYPELCEAETEAFARLLGTHVQRLATIAHGDGVCTTYVPRTTTLPSPANRRTSQ